MVIFIFGDSIAQGLWDSRGGWADRLKAHIHSQEIQSEFKTYHEVYNLGVDGNTTKHVLERLKTEVEDRLKLSSDCAFIFATGTNDTSHRQHEEFNSTPERYTDELAELIKQARQYSTKILFVNLTPANEVLTNPLANSKSGKCYTNDRIDQFNNILHNVCAATKLPCINANAAFKSMGYQPLLADGLHPNDKGHEQIYRLALPYLEKWLT